MGHDWLCQRCIHHHGSQCDVEASCCQKYVDFPLLDATFLKTLVTNFGNTHCLSSVGPWIHASWGLVVAYACGSIPRTENYLLELHERTFRAWDRRKLKSETLNARTCHYSILIRSHRRQQLRPQISLHFPCLLSAIRDALSPC